MLTAGFLLGIGFLVPDFMAGKAISLPYVGGMFVFSILLSLSARLPFIYFCVALLGVLQAIGLWHAVYFGTELLPDEIIWALEHLQENGGEILESTWAAKHRLWPVFILLPLWYVGVLGVYKKIYDHLPHGRWISFLVVIALLFPMGRAALHGQIYVLYPRHNQPTTINVMHSLSIAFLRKEKPLTAVTYKPYEIHKTHSSAKNIIVIMGESARPDYMSLFGYPHETTPLLKAKKTDPNFVFKEGFSGAVTTNVALSVFFNLMREPGNSDVLIKHTSNLFKLAKENGYKTHLISMQSYGLFYCSGLQHVDNMRFAKDFPKDVYAQNHDELLVHSLRQLPLGEKNFIVLHQRNIHSPYEHNYEHCSHRVLFKENDLTGNAQDCLQKTYANAVLVNDLVIHGIIEQAQTLFGDKGEGYVFFTSDHSELLGEKGKYGHAHVDMDCARVPFLVYGINPDAPFMGKIKAFNQLTHYDFGVLIANRLGATVVNPNYKPGHHYIHGLNLYDARNALPYEIGKEPN